SRLVFAAGRNYGLQGRSRLGCGPRRSAMPYKRLKAASGYLLFAFAVLFNAPQALAHSVLVSSIPADGSVVAEPPVEVVLTFNEDVTPVTCTLLDGNGAEIGILDGVRQDGATLHVPLPAGLGD